MGRAQELLRRTAGAVYAIALSSRGGIVLNASSLGVALLACKAGAFSVTITTTTYDLPNNTLLMTLKGPPNGEVVAVKYAVKDGDSFIERYLETVKFDADGQATVKVKNDDQASRDESGRVEWTLYETTEAELKKATGPGSVPQSIRRAKLVVPLPRLLKFSDAGLSGGGLDLRLSKGRIQGSGPKGGGTLTIGGNAPLPIKEGELDAPLDVGTVVAKVDISKVFAASGDYYKDPVDLPVKLDLPTGASWAGNYVFFREQQRTLLWRHFDQIRKGPVRVQAEGSGKAIAWLTDTETMTVLRPASTLGDIGFVALEARVKSRSISCGSYGGGGHSVGLMLNVYDSTVDVYDRRGGRKLDSRSFKASADCPSQVSASRRTNYTSTGSFADRTVISAFIEAAAK